MSDPRDEDEDDLSRRRPWGPFSFFRTSLVLLAIVIAILLVMQFV